MPRSLNYWQQIAILTLTMFCGLNDGRSVSAQQVNIDKFCVHTEVFVGPKKPAVSDKEHKPRPVLETETVFVGTQVYDTVTTKPNGIISKFDLDARVVRLIDRTNEIRTTISFAEIGNFQAGACVRAKQGKNGLLRFLAQPQFIYEFEPNTQTIRLKSEWITYEAIGKPAPVDLVQRFVDFADWSKRLATYLDQEGPAQARVELNKKLKKQNWQVVQVTLRGERSAPELGVVRSEHKYRYELDDEDRNFIQDVEKDLQAFKKVSFSEFRAKRNFGQVVANK